MPALQDVMYYDLILVTSFQSALEAAAFQTLDVVEAMQRDIANTARQRCDSIYVCLCMYVRMYVCMYVCMYWNFNLLTWNTTW